MAHSCRKIPITLIDFPAYLSPFATCSFEANEPTRRKTYASRSFREAISGQKIV